ncbi:unnamed protein product, partial [Choristocarpus tenellus]
METPQLWDLWGEDLMYHAAARRLLREVRHLMAGLDAMAPMACKMASALHSLPSVGAGVGGGGEGEEAALPEPELLVRVREVAFALCSRYSLSRDGLLGTAAAALQHTSAGGTRRLAALCLILHALGCSVAVDAAVCAAASRLLQCCSVHGTAHLEDLGLRAAVQARKRVSSTGGVAAVPGATAEGESEIRSAEAAGVGSGGRGGEVDTSVSLGLDDLRPHLVELRSAGFQLELCLLLHAAGCLRLSSRARVEAAMGFRVGLLLEAWGSR